MLWNVFPVMVMKARHLKILWMRMMTMTTILRRAWRLLLLGVALHL